MAKDDQPSDANDSGYASLTGTGNTTPNTTPNGKLGPSKRPSTSLAASATFAFSTLGFRKKEKLVPILDREVEAPFKTRFQAIKPRFERLLLEHILQSQKPGTKYRPMATRLIMMGTSSKDASAYIVVLCQPEQKDAVQRFVRGSVIQDLCRASDAGTPLLKVAVLGHAPRLRLAVEVVTDAVRATASPQRTTLCGTPIRLRHFLGWDRKATFGGLIKVLTDEGKIRIYGITAGHALQELDDKGHKESALGRMHVDLEEEGDDFLAEHMTRPDADADDTIDIDLDSYINQELQKQVSLAAVRSWSFATPIPIGSVIYPQLQDSTTSGSHDSVRRCYYDWALFETSDYEANKLPGEPKATLVLSHRIPGATGTRPIYMISASAGVMEGQLSPEAGSILLGSSDEFVDAYVVTIDGERGICDGDSGSWVIDRNTHELYGHLVATDVLNGGYVIPMERIFADILHHLHAMAVGLPDNIDILHCRTIAASSRAAVSAPPRVPGHIASQLSDISDKRRRSSVGFESYPVDSLYAPAREFDSGYVSSQTTPFFNSPSPKMCSPKGSRRKSGSLNASTGP